MIIRTFGNYNTSAINQREPLIIDIVEEYDLSSDTPIDTTPAASRNNSPRNPRKRQKKDPVDAVSTILQAIDDINEVPAPQTANQLFYASVAIRAERLSRREQSNLQINVLQLLDQLEFNDEENVD